MRKIYIIGTRHSYQIRPQDAPNDGADAFKKHLWNAVRKYEIKLIAEEMSIEALKGRHTVGFEIAKEENLPHILCDPTSLERQALGISESDTLSDLAKRENEWLRRILKHNEDPVLFVCGANHVSSFGQRCQKQGLEVGIAAADFEAPDIPLDKQII